MTKPMEARMCVQSTFESVKEVACLSVPADTLCTCLRDHLGEITSMARSLTRRASLKGSTDTWINDALSGIFQYDSLGCVYLSILLGVRYFRTRSFKHERT